jgi:hypothetical protein
MNTFFLVINGDLSITRVWMNTSDIAKFMQENPKSKVIYISKDQQAVFVESSDDKHMVLWQDIKSIDYKAS